MLWFALDNKGLNARVINSLNDLIKNKREELVSI